MTNLHLLYKTSLGLLFVNHSKKNPNKFQYDFRLLGNHNQMVNKPREFLSPNIQRFLPKINNNDKLKIGVFVRNQKGAVLGGGYAKIIKGKIPYIFIVSLWLSPEIRGKGLAKQVMELTENIAKQQGCKKSELATSDHQAPGFYKKNWVFNRANTSWYVQKTRQGKLCSAYEDAKAALGGNQTNVVSFHMKLDSHQYLYLKNHNRK